MIDKEKIIRFNSKLGIKTEFFYGDDDILGYSEGNTIYLNLNSNQDFEKTNRHEVLHFFEDTEEFQIIKKQLINIQNLDKLRNDYLLKYYGLYTESDIKNGILDTEIVIDMLSNNSIVVDNDLVKVGDIILTSKIKELESKRYLNLSLNKNLSNMKGLSNWEKIFALNYYNGKDYFGKSHVMRSGDKVKIIKEDINTELYNLYSLINNTNAFLIDVNSPEVIREYENMIKIKLERGQKEEADDLKRNREKVLEELATDITYDLYNEYCYLVELIKKTDYEESFKALMLRETLLKTYKKEMIGDSNTILVNRRKLNESTIGHMTLNEIVLDTIYKNVDNYKDFANLYYAGLNIYHQNISKKSTISLDYVDTYGMGHWIKFDGKRSNNFEYIENAKELAALVQDTPWCTKNSASAHLAGGDFYVFIGNDNRPHIAVRLKDDVIDEVRGIKNGNAQELEDEYRDVAISFLENNRKIRNGLEWLEKEEWNKRLVQYNKDIINNKFSVSMVGNLLEDIIDVRDYKPHTWHKNYNLVELINNIELIKDKIAEYYHCREEEIFIGDVNFSKDVKECPYKIIFGNANFEDSSIKSLGKLLYIGGNASFNDSLVEDLGELRSIGGHANFTYSKLKTLGKLKYIGGKVTFFNSMVENLGELQVVRDDVSFLFSKIKSLGKLKRIGGDVSFGNSELTDTGVLEYIGDNASFTESKITSLGILKEIGGYASFEDSIVEDLGELRSIGRSAYFCESNVTSLKNLYYIGGDAFFSDSIVEDLGELQFIGGDGYFKNSKIVDLKKLENIYGSGYFEDSIIEKLGSLQRIGGYVYFANTHITNLGNLKRIEQDADFSNSKVKDLGKLQFVGRNAKFSNSLVKSLGNLEYIGKDADFSNSNVEDLGKLRKVGADVIFNNSKVSNLGNLKNIGGSAYFKNSMVTDLGDLEYIGWGAYFGYSLIKSLGNLKYVGKHICLDFSNVEDLGNLEYVGSEIYYDNSKLAELGISINKDGDNKISISNKSKERK